MLSASDVSCGLFRCDIDRMSHDRTCVIKLLNSSAEAYRDFFSCTNKANIFVKVENEEEMVRSGQVSSAQTYNQFPAGGDGRREGV